MQFTEIRAKYFPFTTADGFTIRPSTREEVYAFLRPSFDKVFTSDEGRHFEPTPEHRTKLKGMFDRYAVLHHEWFLILSPEGAPVGWHMGEAEDAITFYMRNTGILPEFQNRGLYTAFAERFEPYLAELGYERISSQHKPTNRRMLILKLKSGFDFAGFEINENWGALVKVVKLIHKERRASFYRQFGDMEHL